LEIKAPLPQTQVEYWISGEVHERFRPQLQGQLYVSQRSWVDILCWHDVLPKVVMRVESDEEFIKALHRELQIFNYFIERVMEKICATNELRIGDPADSGCEGSPDRARAPSLARQQRVGWFAGASLRCDHGFLTISPLPAARAGRWPR
jgi:hypothetical protein